jgi:hypothetical protein
MRARRTIVAHIVIRIETNVCRPQTRENLIPVLIRLDLQRECDRNPVSVQPRYLSPKIQSTSYRSNSIELGLHWREARGIDRGGVGAALEERRELPFRRHWMHSLRMQ